MSKYWSPAVQDLTPYVPGEQPQSSGIIKLNTNENPYPASPKAKQALEQFEFDKLRLYPDPNGTELKQSLAQYFSLKTENVFIANGSDEVLALAFMAFFRQAKPISFPSTTYSFYKVYAKLYNIEYNALPLSKDLTINLDDYKQPNGGIIFANPNAPTGQELGLDHIEQLLQQNSNSVVIVDEAYIDFGGESSVSLCEKYDNLLVIQTFSKSRSLAGMRVGYALGHQDLIEGLERVKNSFNSYPLDMLALCSAQASLEDEDYFQATLAKIIATRSWTEQELAKLGFNTLPSKTNFILTQHNSIAASDLMSYLRENNIIVRHFQQPNIDNYLRISIGTDAEMQQLVACLKQYPQINAK